MVCLYRFCRLLLIREHTIKQAIESLLIKGRLDLQPLLRTLDERVEKVELALRGLIVENLHNDPTQLPNHILVRFEDRLQSALRRNPALNDGDYDALTGKLEFTDLRDLQDTIMSKATWSQFEVRFKNKEQ